MKKRILSLVLALQMVLTLLPAQVWAAEEENTAAGEEVMELDEAPEVSETDEAPAAEDAAETEEAAEPEELVALETVTAQAVDATAKESIFDRFIPVNQVYGAGGVGCYDVRTDGTATTFYLGTQYFCDFRGGIQRQKVLRKDVQGCYFKLTCLGTFAALDKNTIKQYFCMNDETAYQIAVGAIDIPDGSNYRKWIDGDTVIIQIDLYDENKQFKQTINKYSAVMAADENGEFLAFSVYNGYECALYFSQQDNIFKPTDDMNQSGGSARVAHIMPVDSWITSMEVMDNLLGDMPPFEYEFIQYDEIEGKEQYMTNEIISVNEFIDPYDTYYMVGRNSTNIDPVVRVQIPNVKDYARFCMSYKGDTYRNVLQKDGTLLAVSSAGKTREIATGVKEIGKAHYLTERGVLYDIGTGDELASGVRSFAEHRYGTVLGFIRNDGSFYMGYSYLSGLEDYMGKFQKKELASGKAKAVVAGGVVDTDNNFYRWYEEVTGQGYDKEAFDRGYYIPYNKYVLGVKHLTSGAVRVFPYEYFTGQEDTAERALTGFVENDKGEMWGFGLQNDFFMGAMNLSGSKDLIKHIFPTYQSPKPAMLDNANFIGLVPEDNGYPYGMVANHCSGNKPEVGMFAVDYLSDVPGGYKAMDRYTYAFDNDPNLTTNSAGRGFRMKPTEFHYLNDSSEVFKALNTSIDPVGNLYLLPNVARSSYHLDRKNSNTVLLERTDGSMWMTQIYPKASASITVAKLGGWECSNAIQITQPTNTTGARTRFVDYIDLVDRAALESSFPGIKETKYPEDDVPAAFMESDYYTQITPGKADKLFKSSGDPFLLLVTKSDCGNCKAMQRAGTAKRIIEEYGVPIYGAVDDYGTITFASNYQKGITTPYFVLVYPETGSVDGSAGGGTRKMEIVCPVVSTRIDEGKIYDIVRKARELDVKTDKSLGQAAEVNGKIPADKMSVSQQEWDVLKLVNRARHSLGKPLLAMPAELQKACNIRENELVTLYEHKRPNGKEVYTTIPEPLNKGGMAENIACNQYDAAQVVNDWLHSPGHYANIMDAAGYGLSYMGVGFINSRPRYWVQMFTTNRGFTNVTTSAGTLTFPSVNAMQKEYLVCTDKEGVVSYLPIDVRAMTKDGNSYTLELVGYTVTLTIANSDPKLDVNGDGWADITDMACLYTYLSTGDISGQHTESEFLALVDMNGDNQVNILDYQALYQRIMG